MRRNTAENALWPVYTNKHVQDFSSTLWMDSFEVWQDAVMLDGNIFLAHVWTFIIWTLQLRLTSCEPPPMMYFSGERTCVGNTKNMTELLVQHQDYNPSRFSVENANWNRAAAVRNIWFFSDRVSSRYKRYLSIKTCLTSYCHLVLVLRKQRRASGTSMSQTDWSF